LGEKGSKESSGMPESGNRKRGPVAPESKKKKNWFGEGGRKTLSPQRSERGRKSDEGKSKLRVPSGREEKKKSWCQKSIAEKRGGKKGVNWGGGKEAVKQKKGRVTKKKKPT